MMVAWRRQGDDVIATCRLGAQDAIRYAWTQGTLTVNVFRRSGGEWVGFDCFTMGEVPGVEQYLADVRAWHDEHVGPDAPDARYVAPHPTRSYLMGGA